MIIINVQETDTHDSGILANMPYLITFDMSDTVLFIAATTTMIIIYFFAVCGSTMNECPYLTATRRSVDTNTRRSIENVMDVSTIEDNANIVTRSGTPRNNTNKAQNQPVLSYFVHKPQLQAHCQATLAHTEELWQW